jgi:hypothetical protein
MRRTFVATVYMTFETDDEGEELNGRVVSDLIEKKLEDSHPEVHAVYVDEPLETDAHVGD